MSKELETLIDQGKLLWHYTDFKGLEGVLNGRLWASSLLFLNDTAEFLFGVGAVLQLLVNDIRRADGSHAIHVSRLVDRLRHVLIENHKGRDIYAVALSERDDDLSQWRAYGSAGPGPSFAIGFDPGKLGQAAGEYGFELRKVRYHDADIWAHIRSELRDEIEDLTDAVRGLDVSETPEIFVRTHAAFLVSRLMDLAPGYKHRKFEGEKEWRLVRRHPPLASDSRMQRRFRLRGSMIVPYLEIPLHEPATEVEVISPEGALVHTALARVMYGPTPHPELIEHALNEMIAYRGLAEITISRSLVPFRNW